MPIVTHTDLKIGHIYVVQGGLVTIQVTESTTQTLGWGYDRVKFAKIENNYIVVDTPWGSKCLLPLDYPLYSTIERHMRSEFPIRGAHKSRKVIPFDEALKLNICKELDNTKIKTLPNNVTSKIIGKRPHGQESTNVFIEELIKYFKTAQTLSSAATHFNVKYQKIRYLIKNIKDRGYNSQRFNVVNTKEKGLNAVRLEPVK